MSLLVYMIVLTHGQQPANGAKSQKVMFPHSCEKTQQIDGTDRLSDTKAISSRERAVLIEAISIQLRPGKKIGTPRSEKKLLTAVMETRVTMVDLNGDGIPEVIVQASDRESCSPTGNCPVWVFTRSGNEYKQILVKNSVQTFGICTSRTDGFFDLVLGQHGSASEQALYIYRFANERYNRRTCYMANFTRLVGDEVQELEEPDITLCKP